MIRKVRNLKNKYLDIEEPVQSGSVIVHAGSNDQDGYNEDDEDELTSFDYDEEEEEEEGDTVNNEDDISRTQYNTLMGHTDGNQARNVGKQYDGEKNVELPFEEEADYEGDDSDDVDYDYDYYDDELDEGVEMKALPRTLPNTDAYILTEDNICEDSNKDAGGRPNTLYHQRSQSQTSSLFKRSPFRAMSFSSDQANNLENNIEKPSKLRRNRRRSAKTIAMMSNHDQDPLSNSIEDPITNANTNANADTNIFMSADHTESNPRDAAFIKYNGDDSIRRFESPWATSSNLRRLVARPPIDTQDKLLAEMEVLADIKNKAKMLDIYEQFPQGFEDKLRTLKQTHLKVLQLLRERDAAMEEQHRKHIQTTNVLKRISTANTEKGDISTGHELAGDNITQIVSSQTSGGRTRSQSPKALSPGADNTNVAMVTEFPMPSVMSNPDTSKHIQKLVDIMKDLR